MKNNFITDYAGFADFQYQIRNVITHDADYADFRDYIKNNFTTDYAVFADFKDYIKLIISPVTRLTTLVLETT